MNEDEVPKPSPESHLKKRRIPGACDICRRKKGTSILLHAIIILFVIADLNDLPLVRCEQFRICYYHLKPHSRTVRRQWDNA